MYEDGTQNYDSEIHEEYLIGLHDALILSFYDAPIFINTIN